MERRGFVLLQSNVSRFKTFVCDYGLVAPTSCSVAMTTGQLWLLAKPSEELSACMGSRLFITGGLVGVLFVLLLLLLVFVVVVVLFVFQSGHLTKSKQ